MSIWMLSSSVAMAQNTTSQAESKVLDYEADEVEGALVKPDDGMKGWRLPGKTASLIKVRQDFIPEIMKSTEDVGL